MKRLALLLPLLALVAVPCLAQDPATQGSVEGNAHAEVSEVATNGVKSPIAMPGVMRSRNPGERGRALAKYGAGGSDASVMRALRWLRTVQNEDGSWPGNPVASTALALWCYFDHNEFPADGTEFGPTIERGLQFLLADLDSNAGRFRSARDEPFAQPLGAFSLSQGFAMTRNPLFREAGPAACRPLLAGQRPDGAWNADPLDPSPEGGGDPFATAVCALVLRRARSWSDASFDPDGALRRATGPLLAFLDPATGAVLRPDGTADPATAVVVYALQKLGRYNDPVVKRAVAFLDSSVFSYEAWEGSRPWTGSGAPLRDWFFVTQVKLQEGGTTWFAWNKQFWPENLRRQTVVPAEESGYSNLQPRPREIGWWDSPSERERDPGADGPALPCERWRGGECVDGETTLGDRVRDTCLSALLFENYLASRFSHFDADPSPEPEADFFPPPRPKTNDAVRVRVTRRHAEPEPHSESSERAD